jgi:hypothetical protein
MLGENRMGESDFQLVFEWTSFDSSVSVYEMLYLDSKVISGIYQEKYQVLLKVPLIRFQKRS